MDVDSGISRKLPEKAPQDNQDQEAQNLDEAEEVDDDNDSQSSEEGKAPQRDGGANSSDEDEMHMLLASVQDLSPRTSGHVVNCSGVEDATVTSEPVSRSLFEIAKRKGAKIIFLPMV